jgi:hypothetical protein
MVSQGIPTAGFEQARSELERNWNRFHAQYGGLEKDGCQWDLWWQEDKFCVRCLAYEDESLPRKIICVYGTPSYMPHQPRKSFEPQHNEYPQLKVRAMGVVITHQYLEVFVRGMVHDFSLIEELRPFLDLAGVKF